MKKLYLGSIVALFFCLVFGFIYSILYFNRAEIALSSNSSESMEQVKKPIYHFVVVAQNTDDFFWQSVRKGVLNASQINNVATEFNAPQFTNIEEEMKYLDIAIASKVDGIVTHVLDEKLFTPLIDKAVGLGIPVVTIVADAKKSRRQSFIGTNSYKLGTEGGKLIAGATGGKAKVAVILSDYSDDGENLVQNLNLSGFKDEIKKYPDIKVITVKSSKMGIFSAEEVTQDILSQYPDVNAIFCTSSKDTVGAAQVVVDMNRVGDVVIAGYDDLPETLRYVENGVIYGTVVGNPEDIGYESMKALMELKKNNRTSSYVDTGVHVVTRKNIAEYKKMMDNKRSDTK